MSPCSRYCVYSNTVVEEKSRTWKHKILFEVISEKSKKNENSLHIAPLLKIPQSSVREKIIMEKWSPLTQQIQEAQVELLHPHVFIIIETIQGKKILIQTILCNFCWKRKAVCIPWLLPKPVTYSQLFPLRKSFWHMELVSFLFYLKEAILFYFWE